MAKIILFDTETTGVDKEDRIIQVGAMIIHNEDNIEIFDELCSTEIDTKLQAMMVHGITPEQLLDKPKYQDTNFAKRLNEFNTKENYLVAHNIPFDLSMVEKEGFVNNYQIIDTLRCSQHLIQSPYHKLQYLRYSLKLYQQESIECQKYNLEIRPHDAISDVLVMKLLFKKLIELSEEKYPTLDPMAKLLELTKQPVLLDKLTFGKYKGKTFKEVIRDDSDYMEWFKKNITMNENLEYTISYYEKKMLYSAKRLGQGQVDKKLHLQIDDDSDLFDK